MWWIRSAYVFGPISVADALERARELHASAGESLLLEAGASSTLARLLAMQGDIERARELHRAARDTYRAAGMTVSAASIAMHTTWIERRAGDLEACEQALRESMEVLERLGERGFFPTLCGSLGECLHLRGRLDEIPDLCATIRATTASNDRVNFVYLHGLEGVVHAAQGRLVEAEAEGRRAVELTEGTDYFFMRAWTRLLLAETLSLAGKAEEGSAVASEALAIHDAKGDVTGAARMRERFAALAIEVA